MQKHAIKQIIPMPSAGWTFRWGWISERAPDEKMHVDYFEILGQALAVDELGNTSIGFYGSSNGVLKLSNSIDDWYAGQGIIASQLGVFPPGMGPNTVAIDELEKHLRTFLNR